MRVWAVISLITPLLIGLLVISIIVQKYDHNPQSGLRKWISVIVLSMLTVAISLFLYEASRPTKVLISNNDITFTGLYGTTVPLVDIKKVERFDTLPHIKMRNNGLGLGSILKEHFKLEKIGTCRLFLRLLNAISISGTHIRQQNTLQLHRPTTRTTVLPKTHEVTTIPSM